MKDENSKSKNTLYKWLYGIAIGMLIIGVIFIILSANSVSEGSTGSILFTVAPILMLGLSIMLLERTSCMLVVDKLVSTKKEINKTPYLVISFLIGLTGLPLILIIFTVFNARTTIGGLTTSGQQVGSTPSINPIKEIPDTVNEGTRFVQSSRFAQQATKSPQDEIKQVNQTIEEQLKMEATKQRLMEKYGYKLSQRSSNNTIVKQDIPDRPSTQQVSDAFDIPLSDTKLDLEIDESGLIEDIELPGI